MTEEVPCGSAPRTAPSLHARVLCACSGVLARCAGGAHRSERRSVSEGRRGRVRRVVCAVDCGTVANPDTVEAQIQGGVMFGITAALYGNITVKAGRVEQTNFDTYQILRMNEAPNVEAHIVQSQEPPGGIGEAGTSCIVPAVINATFAATGKRLRKLPVDRAVLQQPG